jgi:hypothetical protein
MAECRCPHIRVGNEIWPQRSWDDACPLHGVGTEYFRSLPVMPYGYRDERTTTREEWLAFLDGEESTEDN